MLFDTKTMIPQVYSKERTMQVFNRLLDIIMTCCKYNIDNIGDIYDALKCPDEFLPYLGETLNYQYNYSDTVTANRRTIKVFTDMEKCRGSQTGLLMATALSLTSLSISKDNDEISISSTTTDYLQALKELKISYNYKDGIITIDYPNVYTLVRYLIDYVRPVGICVDLRSVAAINVNTDAMLIYANIENLTKEYDPYTESQVENSYVNFSSVGDPEYKESIINQWLSQLGDNNSTFSEDNGGE